MNNLMLVGVMLLLSTSFVYDRSNINHAYWIGTGIASLITTIVILCSGDLLAMLLV